MTRVVLRAGRYTFLVALTLAAGGVMWWVSRPNTEGDGPAGDASLAKPPLVAAPRSKVYIAPMSPEVCDVTIRYSGKIEPWETYTLGFEIAGRVQMLGENTDGAPLDDGDRVEAGQLLARLDDRILLARKGEAIANYELAASDLMRSRRVRERSPGALSEAEYQDSVTQLALAQASQEIALKNLEDAMLISPISGSIVERRVEPGESVNPHETIFEIVENDRLRLVINVPEARVRELELRRRKVAEVAAGRAAGADPEDGVFRAWVKLEGSDVYGRAWPPIDAEVHRIAQTADTVTGMFAVEIMIPNDDGLLRPGMVATAEIVTDRVLAYSAPESAVLFRAGKTYAFSVEPEPTDMKVMFWDIEPTTVLRSRRVELSEWIDLGERILIPAGSVELEAIVTRGQQRLRDGQLVRVIGRDEVPRAQAQLTSTESQTK